MLSPKEKAELVNKFGKATNDTGSPEVQIALFDKRIRQLQEHLQNHKHDESSRRGLLRLVGKRRRLLTYLNNNYPERYRTLMDQLGRNRS